MEDSLFKILTDGVKQIDNSFCNDFVLSKLRRLYDEITLFNPSYGLVNASGKDLVVRHILDCLAPATIISKSNGLNGASSGEAPTGTLSAANAQGSIKMADLGSGSGLPGLVLATVLPNWDISLVERMGRRAGFLRNTTAVMGMSQRTRVIQKDLSEVQDHFNVITFRAFRPFKDIISDLDRILLPGGTVYAYKSSQDNIDEELATVSSYTGCAFTHKILDYQVPMLDAKRRMLVLSKPLV